MNIPRRKFVKTGVVATALAAVPLTLAKAAAASARSTPQPLIAGASGANETQAASALDLYSKARFTPHVNSKFSIRSSQLETVKLTLVEVKDFCQSSVSKSDDCFSLQFTAPARAAFQQNTYEVEHAALGKFSLFLVPVGMRSAAANTVNYEAVINRRSR